MVISHPKTFCMPICRKIKVKSTQNFEYLEYADELASECRCGMKFSSKNGLKQHDSLYCKEKYNRHVYGKNRHKMTHSMEKTPKTKFFKIFQNNYGNYGFFNIFQNNYGNYGFQKNPK